MQSAQSLNRVNLVPRALFRHLQTQGKAPWERGWNRVFLLVLFSFDMALEKREATIMDKSLGTVVQFERFLTHAKLYPRATNTVRPYPLPPPHRQC